MDPKNLIRIRCIPKHREVPTQLDNGAEFKQANEQHVILEQHSQRVPIRYNSNQLRKIADNIKFQKQYKRLTHNTVINVRRLQLNKRGSRGQCKAIIWKRRHGRVKTAVNFGNLTQIKIDKTTDIKKYNRNFLISTANVQSLKNKSEEIHDHIIESGCDIMVLTENLAKNTDEDKCWLQCNELNRGNLKTQVSNKKFRIGGGLAIVHKSNIEVKCIKEGQLNTFQFAIWKVRFNNDNITLIAIYHPPYTISNPFTNTTFIDEYTEWLTDQIGSYDNFYITGDFNIHVNNTIMDDEASAFVDSMEALDLEQHCNFITHKACNTLDLLLTETFSPLQVKACQAGDFISDHCIVQCWVSITRNNIQCKAVTYRKLDDINVECLVDDMKLEDLAEINDVNVLTELCDD